MRMFRNTSQIMKWYRDYKSKRYLKKLTDKRIEEMISDPEVIDDTANKILEREFIGVIE